MAEFCKRYLNTVDLLIRRPRYGRRMSARVIGYVDRHVLLMEEHWWR